MAGCTNFGVLKKIKDTEQQSINDAHGNIMISLKINNLGKKNRDMNI